MRNYWIFQSSLENFDPRTSGEVASGGEDTWIASRYRADMKSGDRVFFWLAGSPDVRGIHATGSIVGTPYKRGDKHFVKVQYEKLLTPHLPIERIESDKRLSNLWILKMALGTNFLLNEREGLAIEDLIRRIAA